MVGTSTRTHGTIGLLPPMQEDEVMGTLPRALGVVTVERGEEGTTDDPPIVLEEHGAVACHSDEETTREEGTMSVSICRVDDMR